MEFSLEGKVALVTGGAQGIGKACCQALLDNGAKVSISDIDVKKGEETSEELKRKYGDDKVIFCYLDVVSKRNFEECILTTVNQFHHLNILINNAGICNETEEGWLNTIQINLIGVINGTKLGFEYLSKDGIIVNVASVAAFEIHSGIPVYSATKAAILQLSRCYGTDLHCSKKMIRVVTLSPELTKTHIVDMLVEKAMSAECSQLMLETVKQYEPLQEPEFVGKVLIDIIKKGSNGSAWIIRKGNPPIEKTFMDS